MKLQALNDVKVKEGLTPHNLFFCLNGGLHILKGVIKRRLLQHPFYPHAPSFHGRPLLSAPVKAAVLHGNLYCFSL